MSYSTIYSLVDSLGVQASTTLVANPTYPYCLFDAQELERVEDHILYRVAVTSYYKSNSIKTAIDRNEAIWDLMQVEHSEIVYCKLVKRIETVIDDNGENIVQAQLIFDIMILVN